MDVPSVGPSAPVTFRRTCERNRLEKQFLIDAYECLVTIIERDDFHGAEVEHSSHENTGRRRARLTPQKQLQLEASSSAEPY